MSAGEGDGRFDLAEFLDLDGADCFGVAVADSNCRGQFGAENIGLGWTNNRNTRAVGAGIGVMADIYSCDIRNYITRTGRELAGDKSEVASQRDRFSKRHHTRPAGGD